MGYSTPNTQKREATSLSGRVGRGAAQEVAGKAAMDKGFELIKHSPHSPPFSAFRSLIGCCCVRSPFSRWRQPMSKDRMQTEYLAESLGPWSPSKKLCHSPGWRLKDNWGSGCPSYADSREAP